MGRCESRRLLLQGRLAEARREGMKNGAGLDSWGARLGQSIAGAIACVAVSWWSAHNGNAVVAVIGAVGALGMISIALQLGWLMVRNRSRSSE